MAWEASDGQKRLKTEGIRNEGSGAGDRRVTPDTAGDGCGTAARQHCCAEVMGQWLEGQRAAIGGRKRVGGGEWWTAAGLGPQKWGGVIAHAMGSAPPQNRLRPNVAPGEEMPLAPSRTAW